MSSECVFITFYSEPIEAFLTSVFRILDVFDCNSIAIFTSEGRVDEAKRIIDLVRSYLPNGIDLHIYPDFPLPSNLNSFDDLVNKIYRKLSNVLSKGVAILAVYTGSRIEVSATVLAVSRARENTVLVYTPFFWGPWSSLFYPFTPKPLEPLVILHPDAESVKNLVKQSNKQYILNRLSNLGNKVSELLSNIGKQLSILRKRTSYEQYKMNLHYTYSTMLYPVDVMCSKIRVSIHVDGIEKLSAEARDYCSAEDVVETVDRLGKGFIELRERGSIDSDRLKALDLLFKFSSILALAVEECSYGCSNNKDLLFIDALRTIGCSESILVDTNVLYTSLHTQLYEYRVEKIKVPLCAYVELLKHRTHYRENYEKLRSEIALLVLDEVKTIGIPLDSNVFQQPCEVGIALARDAIAVTADRHAYTDLFKHLNVKAILVSPKPIKSIRFMYREDMRKISYAYYALAQLKALTSYTPIKKVLQDMKINVEFKQIHDKQ
ncbi:MAG: hypothetical protein QXW20_06850 [Ignisphaera sp.]